MQKTHSFLLSAKNISWLGTIVYCLMVMVLVWGTKSVEAENKKIAVVYAQGKSNMDSVKRIEETAKEAQIPLHKEKQVQGEESVEAMQSELADEIAAAEKKRREQEEKKIHLSKKDREILYRIVEAEATGEDLTGKKLVANVVLNRVNSKEFPDTVEKVVFADGQFSPIRDGRYYKVKITKETKEAVEKVLEGEDSSKGAVYFMSRGMANKKNVIWFDNQLTKVMEYGTHEFFK
ncbi:MAG: cell wall hydrolase [Acetivibrio sp.]